MVLRDLSLRALTDDEAYEVSSWRYEGILETPLVGRPDNEYFAVVCGEELVGYCFFGRNAMIPGFMDTKRYVGVAWGLRPNLVNGGHGRAFVGAIVRFGVQRFSPLRLQAVVRVSNPRSFIVATRAGFVEKARIADRIILLYEPSEGTPTL